jgi:hypothetical protein
LAVNWENSGGFLVEVFVEEEPGVGDLNSSSLSLFVVWV